MHAERLEDGTHRAAGDDAGPRRRRAQNDLAGTMPAAHIMVQRAAFAQRNPDQRALGGFRRLADRLRHLTRLAVTKADAALLIADDDERGKAETTAALDDFRDTIDVDQTVDEFAVAFLAAVTPLAITCHILLPSLARIARRNRSLRLELPRNSIRPRGRLRRAP